MCTTKCQLGVVDKHVKVVFRNDSNATELVITRRISKSFEGLMHGASVDNGICVGGGSHVVIYCCCDALLPNLLPSTDIGVSSASQLNTQLRRRKWFF